ncbi:MAG: DUF4249 family protein [Candidatus Syntrophosphaera sp.]
MTTRFAALLPLFCLLWLASCENTSGPRFEGDVFTLAGLLVAGEPISLDNPVYITRSSAIEDFDPWQIFVADASVTVMNLDNDAQFELIPALHEMKIKYIDPAGNIIQPEHSYRIEAQVPGYDELIWAQTTVPQSVALEPDPWGDNPPETGFSFDPGTQNVVHFEEINTQYPIVVNTHATEGTFNLFGETYCLEEFSTDLEFTEPVFGMEHPDESAEAAYNSGGRGLRRMSFMYRFVSSPLDGLEGNYLVLNNYSNAFIFYGRYRLKVYVIDDNYYNYSFMEDGYLHGGVRNALGYFGAASGGIMYAEIVK